MKRSAEDSVKWLLSLGLVRPTTVLSNLADVQQYLRLVESTNWYALGSLDRNTDQM